MSLTLPTQFSRSARLAPRYYHDVRPRTRLTISAFPARCLQTSTDQERSITRFAFAFDIDGVLVRSSDALPRAHKALSHLQSHHVPFILLTNGGGKHETQRVHDLSEKLGVSLDVEMFVQSHTPFANFSPEEKEDKTVLVVGGDGDNCRHVAHRYGFKNVIMPCDIFAADPTVMPFSSAQLSVHKRHAQPLLDPLPPISTILVFNDPRDWALDLQLITDLLLSKGGQLGTLSTLNNNTDLPNRGYQQDGQPQLWFSNPDLLWAAKHPLPRFGQGGFREALEGVWAAITGGPQNGVSLQKRVIGKPYRFTYEFAEKKLLSHSRGMKRSTLLGTKSEDDAISSNEDSDSIKTLDRVYMVGDNPESDIKGGNEYRSPMGVKWRTALVETGVYVAGSEPKYKPSVIVGDVWDAVQWALEEERKGGGWQQ
ncbi:HAD-superfamily hydrolase [Pseudovirgaria hyperparasitica]|uniref:HAD-superfamily hydrolase n=1 Tax=Pseudovirgaria hyperparasitica TaxID=470096 RepID=A0A6A6W760_9PEZI|nr:HAD-superfamily hydrolase [Pseudovirgaria hyperparasitica]KAF2757407.1 HAD-superfamily hydrolase [Pseudovirgaria hyperparasitica]